MAQLYARVFLKILESSIAEDFTLRHVFEDFLKVAEDGIVDATRPALARRFNIPIETLNESILKLESPDTASRDEEFEGRRIERLDEHRDWGWRILNWKKWDELSTRADLAIRQARHRKKKIEQAEATENNIEQQPATNGNSPTLEEVRLAFSKSGGTSEESERFYNFYSSKGWMIGKTKMRSMPHAVAGWILRNKEGQYGNTGSKNTGKVNPRNIGVGPGIVDYGAAAARKSSVVGQVVKAQDQKPSITAST